MWYLREAFTVVGLLRYEFSYETDLIAILKEAPKYEILSINTNNYLMGGPRYEVWLKKKG